MDEFTFTLPDNAGPDMRAVAQLGAAVAQLTAAVEDLHRQHLALRDTVTRQPADAGTDADGAEPPAALARRDLDRDAAARAWAWLIDFVDWLVHRYQITEEVPACWAQHPALVDELTALGMAWHACHTGQAPGDAPLLWLERFDRARQRIRDWDDYTRCRNGTHYDRHVDLDWPDDWDTHATAAANADLTTRPHTEPAGRRQP